MRHILVYVWHIKRVITPITRLTRTYGRYITSIVDGVTNQLLAGGAPHCMRYLLVVWNMNFMNIHIFGISSSQLTFIFFRGVGIEPTRIHILSTSGWLHIHTYIHTYIHIYIYNYYIRIHILYHIAWDIFYHIFGIFPSHSPRAVRRRHQAASSASGRVQWQAIVTHRIQYQTWEIPHECHWIVRGFNSDLVYRHGV